MVSKRQYFRYNAKNDLKVEITGSSEEITGSATIDTHLGKRHNQRIISDIYLLDLVFGEPRQVQKTRALQKRVRFTKGAGRLAKRILSLKSDEDDCQRKISALEGEIGQLKKSLDVYVDSEKKADTGGEIEEKKYILQQQYEELESIKGQIDELSQKLAESLRE